MTNKSGRFGPLIGAVDEGTTSCRFLVFAAKTAEILTFHKVSIPFNKPQKGWVEQDPNIILQSVIQTINVGCDNLLKLDINPADVVALGLTNQRETTIVWDPFTGKPLYNAIVWCDMRTTETVDEILLKGKRNKNFLKEACGLPVGTYFSAVKLRWLIDNVPVVKQAIVENRCLFGTVDTWLIWNLTGGVKGGLHLTDVTNASRTMLMNLKTLAWDEQLCKIFKIPMHILPEIRSCSEIYGYLTESFLKGVPISGCIGDQQAALVGHMCFQKEQIKCTYGLGSFLLCNTGNAIINSEHGLLSTVAYQLGKSKQPVFALEGSVAVAGAAMKWLIDDLNIVDSVSDLATIAKNVNCKGELYFVPAFGGLYSPHWNKEAKSIICGLTDESKPGHIIKALLEAVAFQIRDILEALKLDYNIQLSKLLVDGGMAANDFFMQIQSDICGVTIVRPSVNEITCLGAAIVAGIAEGIEVWDLNYMSSVPNDVFYPCISENERDVKYNRWKLAIEKSLDWNRQYEGRSRHSQILKSLPGSLFIMSSFIMLVVAEFLSKS
ncbi:glycerol kinase-like isoform X2 [Agrilus planipennis]|uniref:Probable glycerol kinase n=1 Tax=Agrilus planipennis TaxID=224129 RepID=A0A7F5R683_AGRPL|nr:glycerol kinase-like isoform X2 [Agrilus planipennis]